MSKSDLEVLIPENEIKLASGETVVISPFSFAKLPKVVSLINSIGVGLFLLWEAKAGLKVTHENAEEGTADIEFDDLVINKVNEFMESHFDAVVEIMAIYCRRSSDFFLDEERGPNVEEAIQILFTIIARHLGFFTKTLQPIVASIKSKAKPGATSSES
ncbi:hypothetical protein HSX37_16170|uniref:Uncharacterized protein n=1 Tax=Dendrosporobacter quercicolus TaxID=146817 RepID=A0A1G9ZP98_9FIRM|nr:hypothetical protein [Dendrosporobacter quercicolus]NSL49572.1 hypothetical protein [Dendrosporobacter quercicolus DSM 1736]SDN23239.1 hypothetical protein SAMN04488502_11528 [Dendrosporobacter quercicolus]